VQTTNLTALARKGWTRISKFHIPPIYPFRYACTYTPARQDPDRRRIRQLHICIPAIASALPTALAAPWRLPPPKPPSGRLKIACPWCAWTSNVAHVSHAGPSLRPGYLAKHCTKEPKISCFFPKWSTWGQKESDPAEAQNVRGPQVLSGTCGSGLLLSQTPRLSFCLSFFSSHLGSTYHFCDYTIEGVSWVIRAREELLGETRTVRPTGTKHLVISDSKSHKPPQ
jgi:hypothetical protein